MSGGTLLALSAGEIVMDPNAVLGPVDPQLGEYPAASILKAVSQKDKNEIDDRTLILADVSAKAIAQLRTYVFEILKEKMGDEEANQLAEKLATGTWTHDYPLTYEEVKQLGLPVSTDMPEDVYAFMELFPQPKQRVPSVQYLPAPARQRENPGQ
jgi:ClpP class serine protease